MGPFAPPLSVATLLLSVICLSDWHIRHGSNAQSIRMGACALKSPVVQVSRPVDKSLSPCALSSQQPRVPLQP